MEHIATAHPMTTSQPAYGHCPWIDCSEDFAQRDQYPDWEVCDATSLHILATLITGRPLCSIWGPIGFVMMPL